MLSIVFPLTSITWSNNLAILHSSQLVHRCVAMAEAIGLAASIIAVVDLAAKLTFLSKFYIENVKDARQDFRQILREASSVAAALNSLRFLVESDPDFECDSDLDELFEPSVGAVSGCEIALKRLLQLIPEPRTDKEPFNSSTQSSTLKQKAKDAATRLAWPLKKSKALGLLDEISRHKETISLIILGDVP